MFKDSGSVHVFTAIQSPSHNRVPTWKWRLRQGKAGFEGHEVDSEKKAVSYSARCVLMGFILLWQDVPHTNSFWYWKTSQSAEKRPLKKRAATKLPASTSSLTIPPWWGLLLKLKSACVCDCLGFWRWNKWLAAPAYAHRWLWAAWQVVHLCLQCQELGIYFFGTLLSGLEQMMLASTPSFHLTLHMQQRYCQRYTWTFYPFTL